MTGEMERQRAGERVERVLAVIPARGGSKGLPGKNIRSFAGLPLIVHSIRFANLCPEVTRCVVSTDSSEIAAIAKRYGADVPFLRPTELATDRTPMWPVLRHALAAVEQAERCSYDLLLLLDPTSPAREPEDIDGALRRLAQQPEADGVIGVSRPEFNPLWHCVVEEDGWMSDLSVTGSRAVRRQDAPVVYRINGSLYIWRTLFVRSRPEEWRQAGRHVLYEIPERRAMSIDTEDEFTRAEMLVNAGFIRFPWLSKTTNVPITSYQLPVRTQ